MGLAASTTAHGGSEGGKQRGDLARHHAAPQPQLAHGLSEIPVAVPIQRVCGSHENVNVNPFVGAGRPRQGQHRAGKGQGEFCLSF